MPSASYYTQVAADCITLAAAQGLSSSTPSVVVNYYVLNPAGTPAFYTQITVAYSLPASIEGTVFVGANPLVPGQYKKIFVYTSGQWYFLYPAGVLWSSIAPEGLLTSAQMIEGALSVVGYNPLNNTALKPDGTVFSSSGSSGGGSSSSSSTLYGPYVATVDMTAGVPVYIRRSDGHLDEADASVYTKCFVMGLTQAYVAAGHSVQVQTGPVTLSDWTSIAGSTSLVIGVPYFLNIGGGITTVPPVSTGSVGSCLVGYSADSQTLIVKPSSPILL